jgi:dTMP kinase
MTFIVLTGGDKCGKTTQCGLLVSRLREYGVPVFETGVPNYASPVGQALDAFLRDVRLSTTMDSAKPGLKEKPFWRQAYEALHMADKQLVADDIAKAESRGQIVVCSRWAESARIYAEANGFSEEWHEQLLAKLPTPDLTIVIDIDGETYRSRMGANPDKYEANQDLQHRVREMFRQRIEFGVDGARSESKVFESIWKIVVRHLLCKAGRPEFPLPQRLKQTIGL